MEGVTLPTTLLLFAILVLTLLSAYFSSSETAMMKLNPYRLKNLVRKKHRGARKANRLLRRQDRLLGVILIGNNLVNNAAATVAAVIGVRIFGEDRPSPRTHCAYHLFPDFRGDRTEDHSCGTSRNDRFPFGVHS